MKSNNLEKLAKVIKDIQFAMMTTLDKDGHMHSRPMMTLGTGKTEEFAGTLWFFSKDDSSKTNDIRNGGDVLLTYSHNGAQKYVSVSGTATVLKDASKIRELWDSKMETWFPQGVNDPDITLIKVEVESAELWDAPPGKVTKIIERARNLMTGKSYHPTSINGEHLDIKIH